MGLDCAEGRANPKPVTIQQLNASPPGTWFRSHIRSKCCDAVRHRLAFATSNVGNSGETRCGQGEMGVEMASNQDKQLGRLTQDGAVLETVTTQKKSVKS